MFDEEERGLEPFIVASIAVRRGEDSQIEPRRLTTPPAASEMGFQLLMRYWRSGGLEG
jgi:hypothetical protein